MAWVDIFGGSALRFEEAHLVGMQKQRREICRLHPQPKDLALHLNDCRPFQADGLKKSEMMELQRDHKRALQVVTALTNKRARGQQGRSS